MYLGGFFFLPIRFVSILTLIIILVILLVLNLAIFGKVGKIRKNKFSGADEIETPEQSVLYWTVVNFFVSRLSRLIMWWAGHREIIRKSYKVSDFFADYEDCQPSKIRDAPIWIGNHVTVLDPILTLSLSTKCTPSFLAKDDTKRALFGLIGKCMDALQGLYVLRLSESSRQDVKDKIKERVNLILEGKRLPPMFIFPEGTTNNGFDLMHLKQGAFSDFAPLKIFGFTFDNSVSPAWNLLSTLEICFLHFSQWNIKTTLHEFETFDPKYTLKRLGLEKSDPTAWEKVVEDVRYLMDYGIGLRVKGNSTYNMKNELEVKYMATRGIDYKVHDLSKLIEVQQKKE